MKIVFIGGLTNGKIVFDYLKSNKHVDLALTITYPDSIEKPRAVKFPNSENIIKSTDIAKYKELIEAIEPDMIFVAGWSGLIPDEILEIPRKYTVGFHPAKLPENRGRSVIAWQIEEGYQETALTMFKYSDYPDGGDILAQEKILIEKTDYINDILTKIDRATFDIMRAYFPLMRKELLVPRKQDLSLGNFRRLRGEQDSHIEWSDLAEIIYNKIRAISHPYPGAEAIINSKKYKIWESEILYNFQFDNNAPVGTCLASLYDGSMIVKCNKSYLRILKYTEIND